MQNMHQFIYKEFESFLKLIWSYDFNFRFVLLLQKNYGEKFSAEKV